MANSNSIVDQKFDDFLTLKEAAKLVAKTPSNISYLLNYDRLNRYDSQGVPIRRAANNQLRVSRYELLNYFEKLQSRIEERMRNIPEEDFALAFVNVPEKERTKHVHRLHPYLGKFIPQLAEYFLKKYFRPGEFVIDPFCGSGTTLVQAAEMGIHGVGIDVSEFNVLIANVKLARYEQEILEKEILDITQKTCNYSAQTRGCDFALENEYLQTWFSPQSLKEMVFYRDQIQNYECQDILKILLSRTIRSCRQIFHYELATPSRPVTSPYRCYKHKNKICTPVNSIIPRLRFYSKDTIRRVAEFSRLRKDCNSIVIEGDSRSLEIDQNVDRLVQKNDWYGKQKVRGVITSPPYVGQIDYHDQHRYAYELFGFKRRDSEEIGPKFGGKGSRARQDYAQKISEVLLNVKRFLPPAAIWCIVANDSFNLYPEIFARAELKIRKTHHRPVEDRTERDKRPYSESIFVVS